MLIATVLSRSHTTGIIDVDVRYTEPKVCFLYYMDRLLTPCPWLCLIGHFHKCSSVKRHFWKDSAVCRCVAALHLSILSSMDVFVQTRLIVCSSFMLHLFIHLLLPSDMFAHLCGVRSQSWLTLFTLFWQEEQDVCWKIWYRWSEKII